MELVLEIAFHPKAREKRESNSESSLSASLVNYYQLFHADVNPFIDVNYRHCR